VPTLPRQHPQPTTCHNAHVAVTGEPVAGTTGTAGSGRGPLEKDLHHRNLASGLPVRRLPWWGRPEPLCLRRAGSARRIPLGGWFLGPSDAVEQVVPRFSAAREHSGDVGTGLLSGLLAIPRGRSLAQHMRCARRVVCTPTRPRASRRRRHLSNFASTTAPLQSPTRSTQSSRVRQSLDAGKQVGSGRASDRKIL
jgi:hypothetical protein